MNREGGSREKNSKDSKESRGSNHAPKPETPSLVDIQPHQDGEHVLEISDEMMITFWKQPLSGRSEVNKTKSNKEAEVVEEEEESQQMPQNYLRNDSDSLPKTRSNVTTSKNVPIPPVNYNSVTSLSQSRQSQLNSDYLAKESLKCDDMKQDLDQQELRTIQNCVHRFISSKQF